MKASYCFFFLFFVFLISNCSIKNLSNWQYIDTTKPTLTPQVFAKGFISQDSISEYGSIFSKDGSEFYFGIDTGEKSEIHYSQYINGKWSTPIPIFAHDIYSYNDPFLSPSEDRLYYISDMPRNEQDTIKDIDIWYSKKIKKGWSEPVNAGSHINSDRNEYYISFTKEGTMYFASNKNTTLKRKHDFDIFYSPFLDKEFQPSVKVSEAINTKWYEADVFIAPDESYIIFCSFRRTGLGEGDLYISFKDARGEWQAAQNMGIPINSEKHELCPFVTADGKYFFYTSNQDIYWVSTDIFDTFRK